MFLSLFDGNIMAAASSNLAVFLLLPIFAAVTGFGVYKYIKSGDRSLSVWQKVMLYCSLAVLLVFGIARNAFPYDILIP